MKIIIPTLVLALFSCTATAQFETDYKPIQNKGTLPADVVTLSSEKYQADRKELKKEKGSAKKTKDQFLLESNFEIDALLLSGRIVFNDQLSDYVNKVADKVLANDMETRRKLRFYILRSSYVNASATNQGIIFINMGLLAQLENEAQLAFILSHEIVHYKNKHSINHALETEKLDRGKGSYKAFSKEEKLLANRSFSKEQETEADDQGFDIFKKTQYSAANLIGVYDVLKYAYLPFDDIAFDKSIFENNNYKLPDYLTLKETDPINTKDQSENPKSTHPSIKARREMITEKIAKTENTGKSDYLVSKETFQQMRTTARFELSRLYLMHHQYEEGIYNSYMLLRKYPNNLYLKKIVMECIENLAAYAHSGNSFEGGHVAYKDVEGKMQAVNYLFEKMDSASTKDITIMALAYAVKLKHDYPKDVDIDEHTRFLIKMLSEQEIDYDYFSESAPPPVTATTPADSAAKAADAKAKETKPTEVKNTESKDKDGEENSKYAKIKSQQIEKKEEIKAGKGYYAQYALVDYYKESWLKDYFAKNNKDKVKAETEDLEISKKSTVSSKVYALGIEKVLIIDPHYARLNANKKKKYKYLESEEGQLDLVERLKKVGRKAKLDVEVIDSKGLASGDVEKLNDITLLQEYVSERLHDDHVIVPFPEREKMMALAKKYNTDYIMWTGVVSYKDYQKRKVAVGVLSGIFPVILPFTLSYLINGGHYTYYFNMMYDVKNDKVKMVNFREVNSRTGPSILNSHIYDTFLQIRSAPDYAKDKDKDHEETNNKESKAEKKSGK